MSGSTTFREHARDLLMYVHPCEPSAVAVTGNGGKNVSLTFKLLNETTVVMVYVLADKPRQVEIPLSSFLKTTLADLDKTYLELNALHHSWQRLGEERRRLLMGAKRSVKTLLHA